MRYDTVIYFQKIIPGQYDPETGNYRKDTVQETKRYASVVNTSEDVLRLVYGGIKQGSLTVHLQNHYIFPFDCIRVGSAIYQVDSSKRLRNKQLFVISEVQGCRE